MTEEEKKQAAAQPQATEQTTATDGTKKKEPPIWKTNADAIRSRATELRAYANSPVDIDTSGQKDYWHEFLDSRVAQRQQ